MKDLHSQLLNKGIDIDQDVEVKGITAISGNALDNVTGAVASKAPFDLDFTLDFHLKPSA